MMTPQEVSEHAFAKASFGGYNMAMVDEFLDALTGDYTVLYKENAVLKSKMKVLVDKVEEYRTTEDAMRKALLTAQRMADEMVQEAERKKEALLAEAENEARKKIANLRQELDAEAHRLAVAKDNTADFLAKLRAICVHETEFLDKFAQLSAVPAPDPVVTAAREIEGAMAQMAYMEKPAPARGPEPVPPRMETQTPVPHWTGEQQPSVEDLDLDAFLDDGPVLDLDATDEAPGGLYNDITAYAKPEGGMAEQHFEITLGAPRQAPSVGKGETSGQRVDFDHLQFGKDYEIK